MSEIFDLFGDPVPANWGGRGRPEHQATKQNRIRVNLMIAAGWPNSRIAAAMFITQPTLRKHYFSELKYREVARDRLVAGMLSKHWELFMDGNVAAGKEFRDLLRENDLMLYGQAVQPQKPDKAPKLGKKEAAAIAAQNPDTGSTLGELMARRQSQRPN